MVESKTYGAVDVPAGGDDAFDEKNMYYLEASRCTWRKFFRAAVPVAVATALLAACAYGMTHGFRRGGTRVEPDEAWRPLDNTTTTQSGGSGVSSFCSQHDKCLALELTGSCCPTKAGLMLECCS